MYRKFEAKDNSMIRNLFIGVLFMLIFNQCKDRLGPGFDMNYVRDFEIQAGSPAFQVVVVSVENVLSDTLAFFSTNNVTASDITRIRPKSAQAVVRFGGYNLSFLDLFSVYIVDPSDPDNRKEIFYRDGDIPLNEDGNLLLNPGLSDIRDFIVAGKFHIDFVMRLRDPAPAAIPMRVQWTFLAETE
jgi:hypothetical protein